MLIVSWKKGFSGIRWHVFSKNEFFFFWKKRSCHMTQKKTARQKVHEMGLLRILGKPIIVVKPYVTMVGKLPCLKQNYSFQMLYDIHDNVLDRRASLSITSEYICRMYRMLRWGLLLMQRRISTYIRTFSFRIIWHHLFRKKRTALFCTYKRNPHVCKTDGVLWYRRKRVIVRILSIVLQRDALLSLTSLCIPVSCPQVKQYVSYTIVG